MLDGVGKLFLRLFKAAAGVEHALDFHAVFGPLLNLIEIAIVRAERIVGLLVHRSLSTAAESVGSSRQWFSLLHLLTSPCPRIEH